MNALRDDNNLIPVQFEIMEYRDENNKLYIAVAMTKIKEVDVMGDTSLEKDQTDLLSTSTYSIRDIFKNINPVDKLFLKYVPDEFLSEEQISAKREALEEEKKRRIKTKSSDNAYMQAVENGNNHEQQRLVDDEVKNKVSIVPVKLEVKEFSDKQNSLYLVLSLQDTKKRQGHEPGRFEKSRNGKALPVNFSIVDLLQNVNANDVTLTKYIPKALLTDEQKSVLGNKYQISDTTLTSEQRAEIERKAQRREMAKLERENENLKAALALAKKQTKISKDFRHDESETARIANRLIKQMSVVDNLQE